jgi:hypothetical protein
MTARGCWGLLGKGKVNIGKVSMGRTAWQDRMGRINGGRK